MPLEEFIITIFCLIDDLYTAQFPHPLRQRGTAPKLADSEVIAMEIIAEWLGIHEDQAIWKYFKQYWPHFSRQYLTVPSLPAKEPTFGG